MENICTDLEALQVTILQPIALFASLLFLSLWSFNLLVIQSGLLLAQCAKMDFEKLLSKHSSFQIMK